MPKLEDKEAATIEGAGMNRYRVEARSLVEPRGTADGELPDTGELLPFVGIRELAKRCDEQPRRWLVQDVLPELGYGTLAAEYKAGKTWTALDLAVSVATGGRWLDCWPCGQGGVVMFYGEGDEHEAVQRSRAICEAKRMGELPELLTLCCIPPNLGDDGTLETIGEYLDAVKPVLVIVDPLYLSQGGASGRNLGEMGQFLRRVQIRCQQAGAALIVTAHWNKTGNGDGFDRITGTGLQEWSRVMISLAVEEDQGDDPADPQGTSRVTLGLTLGGSRARGAFTIKRKIWSDDRHDLDSPLHYQAWVFTGGPPPGARKAQSKNEAKVLAALPEDGGKVTAQEIANLVNVGLRTVQRTLAAFVASGQASSEADPANKQRRLYSRAAR